MKVKLKQMVVAAVLSLGMGPVLAANCEATIEGNDAMKFNLGEIVANKSCKKFTVTLKHVGKAPKSAMGHNWVLVKTADLQAVATDGAAAGLPKNYLKDGDTRVIASTKVVGGGESTSVSVDLTKLTAGGDYSFFCSFPGHWTLMKGKFKY